MTQKDPKKGGVVIATPDKFTRIKEVLNKSGQVMTRQVIEPKKKK